LFELNIEGLCANTPGAKGRVERAHLTLQGRLVKELRLQRISTVDAANEFMPSFIEDYNRRFGKLPRDRHDAHRPVREDEDLDLTFSWHEARKVTTNLTLQYERKIYMLADNSENRRLIGKYIDVIQFPDGRVEIRAGGQSLPYSTYDRVGVIDQGAVVNHKRLNHALCRQLSSFKHSETIAWLTNPQRPTGPTDQRSPGREFMARALSGNSVMTTFMQPSKHCHLAKSP
jgi:hypothetical protein